MDDARLKITFVCPPDCLAGGMRVIALYADRLARRGHNVTVVLPKFARPSAWEIGRELARHRSWPWMGLNERHSFFQGARCDVRRLDHPAPVTLHDVPDADVVIATWWQSAEWVNALEARKGAKVYFIQGHEVFHNLPLVRCHATYRLPLHKIVIARWLKDIMHIQYGDEIVDLVPNSVDHAQFFAPERGKQVIPTAGFVYANGVHKGMDVLVKALQNVRSRIPLLRVVSFGAAPPGGEFPLPQATEYSCCPAQSQIRNIYAQCDVWIAPSRSEGFYLPAIEAMACRTPVVATRTGWQEEAVKSAWNGVLVDIDDPVALAQGVEWVLSRGDEEWIALSDNAFATVASSSWEASAEMFERALQRACARSARGEIAGQCLSSGKAAGAPRPRATGAAANLPRDCLDPRQRQ